MALRDSFKLGEHVCLVMEAMAMNLRKVLQTYGARQGIAVKAVRTCVLVGWLVGRLVGCVVYRAPLYTNQQQHPPTPPAPTHTHTSIPININKQVLSYTKQLLAGLAFLARKGIVHADLKPDNLVVSQNLAVLKVLRLVWIGLVVKVGWVGGKAP